MVEAQEDFACDHTNLWSTPDDLKRSKMSQISKLWYISCASKLSCPQQCQPWHCVLCHFPHCQAWTLHHVFTTDHLKLMKTFKVHKILFTMLQFSTLPQWFGTILQTHSWSFRSLSPQILYTSRLVHKSESWETSGSACNAVWSTILETENLSSEDKIALYLTTETKSLDFSSYGKNFQKLTGTISADKPDWISLCYY